MATAAQQQLQQLGNAATSQSHKSGGSIATGSYMEGSDTRSISNDMMMIDQNGSVGGGKLGYNNNQYLANAHSAHSELMLGHINDDSVSTKLLSGGGLDSKSDQLDYDQDGGNTETETKSVSSIKSGGSNTDVRYLWLLFVCFSFFYIIPTAHISFVLWKLRSQECNYV